MNPKHFLVQTSCPDEASALRIAQQVVGERLAACAQALPVRSVYRWNGALQQESESLLLLKTTAAAREALETRLRALHPYELPEIIALPVLAGSAAYLSWIEAETRDAHDGPVPFPGP